jgi:hypothetical protein
MDRKSGKKTLVRRSNLQHYSAIILRGEQIRLGDVVKVKLEPDEEGLGTVVDIWMTKQKEVRLRVRWYYSPTEVDIRGSFISQAEVFDSRVLGDIPLEAVIEKAAVMTLAEYSSLDVVDECTFFSRATFIGKRLSPPFSKWECMCVCRQIINPDRPMVLCDLCWGFFHKECVDEPFLCPDCELKSAPKS